MEEKDRGIESFETGAWDTGKRVYCVCKINVCALSSRIYGLIKVYT